jgi:hypothetical protein
MPKSCKSGASIVSTIAALGAVLLLAQASPASARPNEETFSPVKAITVPGGPLASFDISYVDPYLGLLFVADRSNKTVDVVSTGIGKNHDTVIEQLTDNFAGFNPAVGFANAGPNGVLTIGPNAWVGDGNSLLKILNIKTGGEVAVINTGGTLRADELCFDPRDQIVLIANDSEPITPQGGAPFDSFISTKKGFAILGRLTLNGTNGAPLATNGIEQCQWSSRTGMFYQNIPEVNGPGDDTQPGAVLVINPVTEKIVKTFTIPLGQCAGPQGMALGPETQILLGCNDPNKTIPNTVVIDLLNGKAVHVLANEDGSDEVWYNPGDGHYFLARSGGKTGPELGVVDGDSGIEDASQTTATSAHSVAADPVTNEVYVPINAKGGTVCSSVGGVDTQGCIAVYEANASETAR